MKTVDSVIYPNNWGDTSYEQALSDLREARAVFERQLLELPKDEPLTAKGLAHMIVESVRVQPD